MTQGMLLVFQREESRDAAKFLTRHKRIHFLHPEKNYLDQNTNSAEGEKPWANLTWTFDAVTQVDDEVIHDPGEGLKIRHIVCMGIIGICCDHL